MSAEPAAKATPGPWRFDEEDGWHITGPGERSVARVLSPDDFPCADQDQAQQCESECEANGQRIVLAVNAHDALAEALEMFERATDSGDADDYIDAEKQMRAALKLVRDAETK